MPPKPKFTRDEIAAIAYQMIKEGGVSSLTARDLGSRMGTSARPIFTLFKKHGGGKASSASAGRSGIYGSYPRLPGLFPRL